MEKAKGTIKAQLMLAIIAAAACIVLSGMFAQNAYANSLKSEVSLSEFKGTTTGYLVPGSKGTIDVSGKSKITALKSSNKKVATVKKNGSKAFTVTMKKTGTAKISFKANGKKRTVTLKVKKWTNPLKSFKIGSTEIAGKFKKTDEYSATKNLSGKLSVKPKSGWKVTEIQISSALEDEDEGWIAVKNDAKIKNSTWLIMVSLENKSANASTGVIFGNVIAAG